MLGEGQIQNELKNLKPPYVFLESLSPQHKHDQDFLFAPLETVEIFRDGQKIEDFFERLEIWRKKGFWLAGYFTYEFGFYLDEAFKDLRKNFDFDLAWVGVCETPREIKPQRLPQNMENLSYLTGAFVPQISEGQYEGAIGRIKQFLETGLTYQVNYTFKQKFHFQGDPLSFYFALRRSQPTRYAAFIHTGSKQVVSLSPELFFQVDKNKIMVQPMKGTCARGYNTVKDEENLKRFISDAKTRAENLMIVDLLRNDLGRVCSRVTVKKIFEAEKYPTLFQMTSSIEGQLKKNTGIKNIFTALFPSGSVTGAPKIKTMHLIDELEAAPRGVYTGAIGYIAPKNKMCFSVAIRTAQMQKDSGELGIGGGIVYDSIAQEEYKEALLKARFLTRHYPHFDLIETLLWERRKGYLFFDLHLARLGRSCEYFLRPHKIKAIRGYLLKVARRFKEEKIRVRLAIDPHGDITFNVREEKNIASPQTITLCESRLESNDVFLYHKTSHRSFYDEHLHKARAAGFFETIFLNENGELTEGSFTNLFIEERGTLFTPPVACGLLPGVLREHLLSTGQAKEKILYPADLKTADKIFVGNSVRGLIEVEIL